MSSMQPVAAQPISPGITVREFAEINSMSAAGVSKQIREGFIPAYRRLQEPLGPQRFQCRESVRAVSCCGIMPHLTKRQPPQHIP
ncbi:MAG: hypothetical protein QOI30_589 [Mycobacterium sp.]|nr:hypothetical protein [Mycobacterium sp.]